MKAGPALILTAAMLSLAPQPVPAVSPGALAEANRSVEKAAGAFGAAQESDGGQADRVEAMVAYQLALKDLRTVVNGAGRREREASFALARRQQETARLLASLQALGRTPPQMQSLHPAGPPGAVVAADLMVRMQPALEARVAELTGQLSAIGTARRVQNEGMESLKKALERFASLHDSLGAEPVSAEEARAGLDVNTIVMLRESNTLSELASGLTEGKGAAAERDDAAASPGLLWPVPGRVSRQFRKADGAGVRRPGIDVVAPSMSLVQAPLDARVRYAGPFIVFGHVVALEAADGVLVLMAGLAEINVRSGDRVARGDLIGMLGGRPLGAEEYVMLPESETGAGMSESLYIEIRHGREPVDPVSWFDEENG